MATRVKRTLGLWVVVVLVVVQGVLALLRANQWFHVGADLWGQGLALIPLMGLVAIGRGGLIAWTALLYICSPSEHSRAKTGRPGWDLLRH